MYADDLGLLGHLKNLRHIRSGKVRKDGFKVVQYNISGA